MSATCPLPMPQGYEPAGTPQARVVFVAGVDLPGLEFGKTPRSDTVIMSANEVVPVARGTYQARKENAYDIVFDGATLSVRCHGADWWACYPAHMVKMHVPARDARHSSALAAKDEELRQSAERLQAQDAAKAERVAKAKAAWVTRKANAAAKKASE